MRLYYKHRNALLSFFSVRQKLSYKTLCTNGPIGMSCGLRFWLDAYWCQRGCGSSRLSAEKVRDVFIPIELQIKIGTVLLSGLGTVQVSEKQWGVQARLPITFWKAYLLGL